MKGLLGILLLSAVVMAMPAQAYVVGKLLTSEDSEEAFQYQAPRLKQALAAKHLEFGAPIYIQIFKASRELELWVQGTDGYELFRTYEICEMSGELGPKIEQGDEQAPEGFYTVTADWMHPHSSYHLAFNIGYPNRYDEALGRTGSAIMVHGECSSSGCFAMTDDRIEEIYTLAEAALREGQHFFRVHIFPFRMTDKNLQRHQRSPWFNFWANLKQGHDYFVVNGYPPHVWVGDETYRFE